MTNEKWTLKQIEEWQKKVDSSGHPVVIGKRSKCIQCHCTDGYHKLDCSQPWIDKENGTKSEVAKTIIKDSQNPEKKA